MNQINFKQIVAGVSVMFSMMFLLIIAGNLQNAQQATTTIFKDVDKELAKPLRSQENSAATTPPNNVVAGSFNADATDDVVYADDKDENKLYVYKPIHSDKLKQQFVRPVLKVEVAEDGNIVWKDSDWNWIDYDQGVLYFLYQVNDNSSKETLENYTGNYQLIF